MTDALDGIPPDTASAGCPLPLVATIVGAEMGRLGESLRMLEAVVAGLPPEVITDDLVIAAQAIDATQQSLDDIATLCEGLAARSTGQAEGAACGIALSGTAAGLRQARLRRSFDVGQTEAAAEPVGP